MTKVYLFKAPPKNDDDEPDAFAQELEKDGYSVETIPVIQFTNVNAKDLENKLGNSSQYSGLILTSKRAVQALASLPGPHVQALASLPGPHVQALASLPGPHVQALASSPSHNFESLACSPSDHASSILWPWQDNPVYVVGPATADSATALGLKPSGEVAGNADKLSDWITKHHPPHDLPLLFPHGDLARDVLCSKLGAAGVSVDDLVVYQTHPSSNLPNRLANISSPDYFVYFSPSGVTFTVPLLRELEGGQFWDRQIKDKVKIVAIGPTTKCELEKMDVPVHAEAAKPTPAGVLKALKRSN